MIKKILSLFPATNFSLKINLEEKKRKGFFFLLKEQYHRYFNFIYFQFKTKTTTTTTGAVGGICALANILGDECCQLLTLSQQAKLEEARELQLKLIAPNQAVSFVLFLFFFAFFPSFTLH